MDQDNKQADRRVAYRRVAQLIAEDMQRTPQNPRVEACLRRIMHAMQQAGDDALSGGPLVELDRQK